jgi:hypothetical protein
MYNPLLTTGVVTHLNGDESACISARQSVMMPSCDGLACSPRAMKRYTAGRTAISAPSTMHAKHTSTLVRHLTTLAEGIDNLPVDADSLDSHGLKTYRLPYFTRS